MVNRMDELSENNNDWNQPRQPLDPKEEDVEVLIPRASQELTAGCC